MSEEPQDNRVERLREYWLMAQTDANLCRDALKQILQLCEENRRGIVGDIEAAARYALQRLTP